MDISLRRRALLAAGISASFLALVPDRCLAQDLSAEEQDEIGPGAPPADPYQSSLVGKLSNADASEILSFAASAIAAWQFGGMDDYIKRLPSVLELKTNTPSCPSYLAEYKSAAQLMRSARARFGSTDAAFLHMLFERRRDPVVDTNTRIGRSRTFCLDELVRHIVANGGFRKFGLVNYGGSINVSFYDERAYRRNS